MQLKTIPLDKWSFQGSKYCQISDVGQKFCTAVTNVPRVVMAISIPPGKTHGYLESGAASVGYYRSSIPTLPRHTWFHGP